MANTYTITPQKLRDMLQKDAPLVYQRFLILHPNQYKNKEFRKEAESVAKNNNAVVIQDRLVPKLPI